MHWLAWLLLAAIWFATAPLRPLFDPDEGRYAEIPREMLASGDWVTPRLNELKYFEKPPLQYWATAAAFSVFGVHEWSARLWGMGLAFLCLPLVYIWTNASYGRRAALAATGALATSPLFVVIGQLNLLDAGFTFWLTATLLAFSAAQRSPVDSPEEPRWMLAAWAAAAFAVLSKGIVVGVLGGATLLVYALLEPGSKLWRRLHLGTGLPLFLLIASPWFIAVSLRNPEFPRFFFLHEHFERFLTTVHDRVEPWWFFVPILALGSAPWLPSLARACPHAWRETPAPGGFRPLKFLLIFAAVTLVFFSASGSKLVPYILPALPALAVIVGVHAAQHEHFMLRAAQISLALFVVAAVGLGIHAVRRAGFVPPPFIGWASAASVLALLAWWFARRAVQARAAGRAVWVVAVGVILGWQCLMNAYAALPSGRSARDLVSAVAPLIDTDTPLFNVGQYRQTIPPYLGRTLTVVHYRGELAFGLDQAPGKDIKTLEEFLERWQSSPTGIAFCNPRLWDELRARGMAGRVIAVDRYTVAVSRR